MNTFFQEKNYKLCLELGLRLCVNNNNGDGEGEWLNYFFASKSTFAVLVLWIYSTCEQVYIFDGLEHAILLLLLPCLSGGIMSGASTSESIHRLRAAPINPSPGQLLLADLEIFPQRHEQTNSHHIPIMSTIPSLPMSRRRLL